MGALDGRVAIITGAGRGIGRAHALLFAAEGACLVVNDRGAGPDGTGTDRSAAESVVDEITAAGGEAVASHHDVADWDGGRELVATAIDAFGDLDILVNNAGILRDRLLVNMSEEEWDDVIAVHLKGHFVPTRWAAAHWRDRHDRGNGHFANVVHTSSTSGLVGNPGQTNYGSAKAGVGAFSAIVAQELERYGVRSNCVVPAARTRLTQSTPGLAELLAPPNDGGAFDVWDPANVSPLVAYLSTEDCPFTGATFFVQGGSVRRFEPWRLGQGIDRDQRWTVEGLADEMPRLQG
ncbi:SDR family oxidoreductase [soil metagenome]